MAILNYYISVTAASTPISQDSPPSPPSPPQPSLPNRRRIKIILPKKKPQKWSTGVSPGDYGGPPTTSKLRKYWGGQQEDPITSSDFIWNKDFMGQLEKLVQDQPDSDVSSVHSSPPEEQSSGFLSLSRVMSLDSLEVDLSASLIAPSRPEIEQQVENAESVGKATWRWKPAPTRREQKKWDRTTKAATGGSDVMLRESKWPQGDPEVLSAQARQQYYKLKQKLQILTLSIGGVGLFSAYVSYTPETALSFGAGLLGSLVYIRMLGSSVDSIAGGAKGVIKGAIAQPRLLIPVVLVMTYNRWNEIAVSEYGLMHLELIPMLVGFFTYKIATFVQAIEDVVSVVGKKPEI